MESPGLLYVIDQLGAALKASHEALGRQQSEIARLSEQISATEQKAEG